MNNLEIIWIAVGIALTTATQLRSESPVGLGEIMLAAWMLRVGIKLLITKDNLVTNLTKIIFSFWLVSFASLALGLLIADANHLTSLDADIQHDSIALVFSFFLCIALSMSLHSKKDIQKLVLILISFITISLVLILAASPFLPFLAPWYAEVRFQGWSTNPNQLALVVSPIPFFCLELILQSEHRSTKIWCVLLTILSVIIGVAIQSDALILSWLVGVLALILLLPYRLLPNQRKNNLNSAISILITIAVVLFADLAFGHLFYEKLDPIFNNVYNNGSQGSVRVTLWRNGLIAASHSPLFGLGPGPHSGLNGPLLNFEAHNTFIDWVGSAGIVGLISYIALLGWVSLKAWRTKSVVLVAAITSLVVFTCFHFVSRHAIYWFYLLAIASLSTQELNKSSLIDNSIQRTKNLRRKLLQP